MEKKEYIVCKICGEKLRQMSNHLTSKHQINVKEYKRRFPDARTITPSVYDKLSARRRNVPPWNKGLTKETDPRVAKNAKSVSKYRKGKTFEEIYGSKERAEEEKQKRSKKRKGKRPHNKYNSVSKKVTGKPKTEACKKKVSHARKGKKDSDATRKRKGEATRKRWEKIRSDPETYNTYVKDFQKKFKESFALHEKEVLKQKRILEEQGFRVIPIHARVPRSDLIAIKGGKVYAVEIEMGSPPKPEYDKYDNFPFFDDVIWILKDRRKRGP